MAPLKYAKKSALKPRDGGLLNISEKPPVSTFRGKKKPAAQRAKIAASWNDDRRTEMSKLSTIVNEIENAKLRDFTCPDCGPEFKQITKVAYGGHRRFCLHYSGIYKVWLTWEGTVAEFAELYGISRATIYNWINERKAVEFK